MMLCKLGIHKKKFHREWLPSFDAKIITGAIDIVSCHRCGKILSQKEKSYASK